MLNHAIRDQQALEVDFVIPGRAGNVTLAEAKSGSTVRPEMAVPMQRVASALRAHGQRARRVDMVVLYEPGRGAGSTRALAPGSRAVPWREFFAEFEG